MLRTLVLVLAIGAPSVALAEDFPQSAVGIDVVADDGAVIGRVASVERDADGNIVAVEIPGLEPPDAPRASRELVAERDDVRVRERGDERRAGGERSAIR